MGSIEKIAKKIPDEVYVRAAATTFVTFEKLVAPITETTDGLGRYIKQKFDNMVEVEKSLALHALECAVDRSTMAENIDHPKSFVKALEEVSQETDPLLSEMWINLLSCQLSNNAVNPGYVSTLSSLGRNEAILLDSITSRREYSKEHQYGGQDLVDEWVMYPNSKPQAWNASCALLCQLRLADVINTPENKSLRMLVRSRAGDMFLNAVRGNNV